jgi:hypothetical protein
MVAATAVGGPQEPFRSRWLGFLAMSVKKSKPPSCSRRVAGKVNVKGTRMKRLWAERCAGGFRLVYNPLISVDPNFLISPLTGLLQICNTLPWNVLRQMSARPVTIFGYRFSETRLVNRFDKS